MESDIQSAAVKLWDVSNEAAYQTPGFTLTRCNELHFAETSKEKDGILWRHTSLNHEEVVYLFISSKQEIT